MLAQPTYVLSLRRFAPGGECTAAREVQTQK